MSFSWLFKLRRLWNEVGVTYFKVFCSIWTVCYVDNITKDLLKGKLSIMP